MTASEANVANAAKARALYLGRLSPAEGLDDWRVAVRQARKSVGDALRASRYLSDVAAAMMENAAYSRVFRHVIAPPMSQDQFKLACPEWSKSSENNGRTAKADSAAAVAVAITARLDRSLAGWVGKTSRPSRREVRRMLEVVPTLIAQQTVATVRRKRLATEQENAVVDLLLQNGWTRDRSRLIDHRAQVEPKHFMHKTRFASSISSHQEVDVACGLKGTYVVALECKVTNDDTNSVKRVNDVLKKATAWKAQWGAFVHTAALLQGVVKANDAQRLTDAGVHVFWSHDLDAFGAWLDAHL